ncbi:MAG: hypothetical protein R3A45_05765 [Bdellovibrionota bacterium]
MARDEQVAIMNDALSGKNVSLEPEIEGATLHPDIATELLKHKDTLGIDQAPTTIGGAVRLLTNYKKTADQRVEAEKKKLKDILLNGKTEELLTNVQLQNLLNEIKDLQEKRKQALESGDTDAAAGYASTIKSRETYGLNEIGKLKAKHVGDAATIANLENIEQEIIAAAKIEDEDVVEIVDDIDAAIVELQELEKQYADAIAAGNFEEAEEIRKKIIDKHKAITKAIDDAKDGKSAEEIAALDEKKNKPTKSRKKMICSTKKTFSKQ